MEILFRGTCRFFYFLFFHFSFQSFVPFLILYQAYIQAGVSSYTPLFLFYYIKLPSTYRQVYLKVMTCIGMPRNLGIVKLNNKDFADVFVLQVSGRFESKNFQFRMFSHLILAVCSPLVTYEIRICCRVKPRFKICYELKTVFKKTDR